MRICILTHTFPRYDGDTISSIFMAELAQSLVNSGNEVFVLMPFTPLFKYSRKNYKVVTYKYIFPDSLHKLGYSETLSNDMGLPIVMWLLSPFMYLFGMIALLKLVKKEKIDIINAHWILPNGFIASIASILTGVPVVSTLPGSDVYMARKNFLFKLLAKFAAWKSKWITSNSPQLLIDLESITEVRINNKTSNIAYGIGSDKFKQDTLLGRTTRKSLDINDSTPVILGVGRLVAKKGFKYLIMAAKEILKKHRKVKFVLIGDGEERENLEKLAIKLGISENFVFLGNISYVKMNDYYNMADIFILPSIRDSKGNLDDQSVAVMDAMACGKPVVTTDFLGYRTVVENKINGFLVTEKDYKGIAKSLITLIVSKKIRQEMGKRNISKISSMFSWNTIGRQYSDLFKALITSPYYSQSLPSILDTREREIKAKQIYNVLRIHLGETKSLRCLDVGCSDGTITNYLSKYFKEVVGIDVDREAINLAKSKYKGKNIKFIDMPGEKIDLPSNSFDVIIANQLYEFVEDDEKTFTEIERVLKKGGICFLGARNKYAIIEAQYNVPFLSFIPKGLADLTVKLLGKGNSFIGKYKDYEGLKRMVRNFKVHDYTVDIMRNPKKYGFLKLVKYGLLSRVVPFKQLISIIPNYIWILEKK